jgi:hypothetical protein
MVGVAPGKYTQISNCVHAYVDNPVYQRVKDLPLPIRDPYKSGLVRPFPLITNKESWNTDLARWMDNPSADCYYGDDFFNLVAKPMAIVHKAHKENRDGLAYVGKIAASDWRLACTQWLERRYAND